MVNGALLCAGMVALMGEGLGMETAMGVESVDGIKEGPGMGWEFDVDSVEVDSDKHELIMRR